MPATYDVVIAARRDGQRHRAASRRRGRRVLGLDRSRRRTTAAPRTAAADLREPTSSIRLRAVRAARLEAWSEIGGRAAAAFCAPPAASCSGRPRARWRAAALRSARLHRLPYESSRRVSRAPLPAFVVPENEIAVWGRGRRAPPERCVGALLELARRGGAELRFGETVRVGAARPAACASKPTRQRAVWRPGLARALDAGPSHRRGAALGRAHRAHWSAARRARAITPGIPDLHLGECAGPRVVGFPDLGDGVNGGAHHRARRAPGSPAP